ncbi:GDSL family lipase [Flavisolibacter sp. BT320]|nr:GDSL family lipase [Flavisolibacter longurius]
MVSISRIVFVACCFVLSGCVMAQNAGTIKSSNKLSAADLKPFGRTILQEKGLALVSSASNIGFTFEGPECRIRVSLPEWLDHNYLQYELDGQYMGRLAVFSKDTMIGIYTTSESRHTVWIYKATEAHTGPVFIQQIEAENISSLQRPVAPLIEFIGNSITCGAAADHSEVPCGTGVYHDQHNAYMAYGPQVARALNANFLLSSVSGIGVYRNWNSDGPTMPQVYEYTDFQPNSSLRWNFSNYSPDVVSIALGTNDFSRGEGKKERPPFDSTRFVKAYISFVQQVQANYPAAQLALLSSPMLSGSSRELLQNCITAVKAGVDAAQPKAKPLAIFFFQPMQANGCSGHPSVADHGRMAESLLPFFRKLLP